MRGARHLHGSDHAGRRIIPANAGSTKRQPAGPKPWPGSSPRMRGARTKHRRPSSRWGIIPANAGSTRRTTTWTCWPADHPRECGEHLLLAVPAELSAGSSPRMRGAQRHKPFHLQRGGIIPANAGSTTTVTYVSPAIRDHPRECGEHLELIDRQPVSKGSSPRMRGAPTGPCRWPRRSGIIPANAGST